MSKSELYSTYGYFCPHLVVATSRVDSFDPKTKIPKGKLLRSAIIKNTYQGVFENHAKQSLIHESHSIFCRTQAAARRDTLSVSDLLSLSLEYRSVIRSARLSLEDSDLELKENLKFNELIFCLVEAIFLKSQDSSIVVDLINWARLCFLRVDYVEEITECLCFSKVKSLDEEVFWRQVNHFLLCGSFSNAASFLETYGRLLNDEIVKKLAEVVNSFKIELLNSADTQFEFVDFQRTIRDMCTSGHFRSNPKAESVALLLSGDKSVFNDLSCLVDYWFELVPAYAVFLKPCASLSMLQDIVQDCMILCGVNDENEGAIDVIMESLFMLDATRSLQNIASATSDWWLAAHLADLLHKADNRTTNVLGTDIRQFLFLEYATSLFFETRLWRICIDYLKECGTEGLEKLEFLIDSLPIENDKTAIKLINVCNELNMGELANNICRSMSLSCLRQGQWGNSLTWALRSSKASLHSIIAEMILLRCPKKAISSIYFFNSLPETFVISSSLAVLHDYIKFRRYLEENKTSEAVFLLIGLIISDFAPPQFFSRLLDDLFALMNSSDEVVMEKEQIMHLLLYFSTIDSGGKERNLYLTDDDFFQIDKIRFKLLKNLSNAFLS